MRLVRRVILLLALLVVPAQADVTVVATPANVTTRIFDPKRPPSEMPKLSGDEAAVAQSKFICGVQVEIEISQPPDQKPIATVTGIDATLKLDVVKWLPKNATEKIRRHEDGHREISELFYAEGKPSAEAIAKKYIGRRFDVPGVKPEQTTPIIQRIANEFCEEYLGQIEIPSQAVQEKYDQLTDHGRNKMTEAEAIKRAMQPEK